MGYPKLATKAQADAALAHLAHTIRRDLSAAAYVRDRAEQYKVSSGSHVALIEVAIALENEEHFAAFKAGELDDLIVEAMHRRSERIRKEAERYAAEIRAGQEPSKAPGGTP